MFEYIHSSFPDRKRSPEYPIFFEMKSSLKLVVVFELLEGVVGFEYIHFSFPDRKRSPEYPIFSEMKSSLKLMVVFELFEGVVGFEYIHSSFPDRKRSSEYPQSSLKWRLLWNSWSSLNYSKSLRLSGLEFFSLRTRDLLQIGRLAGIKLLKKYVRWR